MKKKQIKHLTLQQIKYEKKFFEQLKKQYQLVNPMQILARGFTLTRKEKKVITSVLEVSPGEEIITYLKDGIICSIVKSKQHE